VAAIAWHTLVQRSRSLLAWTLGLVLITVMQLAIYPSMASSGDAMQEYVDAWPEALREAFGLADYTTGAGYLNTELFSMMLPLVLIGVALAAGAAATAGEEEQGTLELLLGTPVRRSTVLAGKVVAMAASVAVVSAAFVVTLIVGAPLVDLSIGSSYVIAATLMLALLAVMFGSVCLRLGALSGHRAVSLGAGFGLAIAAYLLNVLAPLADWLEPWQSASPFEWALGDRPLFNGLALGAAALIIAVAAAIAAPGFAVFALRDIATR
jgi:ABC-2 type transport system permease protein